MAQQAYRGETQDLRELSWVVGIACLLLLRNHAVGLLGSPGAVQGVIRLLNLNTPGRFVFPEHEHAAGRRFGFWGGDMQKAGGQSSRSLEHFD